MVVCEGGVVVNLVASLLMNGVCCIHSINEEEERKREQRESLQKTIRVEWQRQRLFEKELKQQEKLSTLEVQDRRKSLMRTKRNALSLSSTNFDNQDLEANESTLIHTSSSNRSPVRSSWTPESGSSCRLASPAMIMAQRRVQSTPTSRVEVTRRISRGRGYESDMSMSSLMDDIEDDFDEPLEDVALL